MRAKRKGRQRRTRHHMPDLTRGGSIEAALAEERGVAVRRGPQAELCKSTACCVCWSIIAGPVEDWATLPAAPDRTSIPHHEPEGIHGDDDDTLPLCDHHHAGPAFKARHPGNARPFWKHYGIDWEQVRDEMRRRVEAQRG